MKELEESFVEQMRRVESMALADRTWDLSPNDMAAIAAVLRELRITQRALEISERSAPWRSAYLAKAIGELYPETEQPDAK